MLFNAIQILKPYDLMSIPHRAKVMDTGDPLGIGRIKVHIKNVLEEPDLDKLPWFHLWKPMGFGGATAGGSCIPNVGDDVTVEWPFNDFYHGFYRGVWCAQNTAPQVVKGGQPQRAAATFAKGTGNQPGAIVVHGVVTSVPANTSASDAVSLAAAADYSNVYVTGDDGQPIPGPDGQPQPLIASVQNIDGRIAIAYTEAAGQQTPQIEVFGGGGGGGGPLAVNPPQQVIPSQSTSDSGSYPNVYGITDEKGNYMRVDKHQGFAEFVHQSGSYVRFEPNGDVKLHVEQDLLFEVVRDFTTTVGRHRSTTLLASVDSGNDSLTLVKGNRTVLLTEGNLSTTLTKGDQSTTLTQGNRTVTIVGNDSLTLTGNRTTIITGGDTSTVTGAYALTAATVSITGTAAATVTSSGPLTLTGTPILEN